MFPSEKPKKDKTCQYNVNIDQTCRFGELEIAWAAVVAGC